MEKNERDLSLPVLSKKTHEEYTNVQWLGHNWRAHLLQYIIANHSNYSHTLEEKDGLKREKFSQGFLKQNPWFIHMWSVLLCRRWKSTKSSKGVGGRKRSKHGRQQGEGDGSLVIRPISAGHLGFPQSNGAVTGWGKRKRVISGRG